MLRLINIMNIHTLYSEGKAAESVNTFVEHTQFLSITKPNQFHAAFCVFYILSQNFFIGILKRQWTMLGVFPGGGHLLYTKPQCKDAFTLV